MRVRPPEEVRGVRTPRIASSRQARLPRTPRNIEDTDFMQTKPLRWAIHQREGGRCFLLFAPSQPAHALPGPRCPARELRGQFLPQPRLLLCGLQLAKMGALRRRASARALPRATFGRRRAKRPPPCPGRPRRRQAQAANSGPEGVIGGRGERRRLNSGEFVLPTAAIFQYNSASSIYLLTVKLNDKARRGLRR